MTTRWRRSTAPAAAVAVEASNSATTKKNGAAINEWTRSSVASPAKTATPTSPTAAKGASSPAAATAAIASTTSSSTPRRATTGTGGVTAGRKTSDASSSLRVALLERNAATNERLTKSTPSHHRYLGASPSSSVVESPNVGSLGEAKHSLFATNSPIEERLRSLKLLSNAGQNYERTHQESSVLNTKPKSAGLNGSGIPGDETDDSDSDMDGQPRRLDLYKQLSEAGSAYEDVDPDDSDDSVMSNDSVVSVSARTGYRRKTSARATSGRRANKHITNIVNSSRHGHHGHSGHGAAARRNSNPRVVGTRGRPPIDDDDDDDDWANDSVDSLVVGRPLIVDAPQVVVVPPQSSSSSSSQPSYTGITAIPPSSSSSLQCPVSAPSSSSSRPPRSRSPSGHRNGPLSPPPGSPGKIPTRLTSRRPPSSSPSPPIPIHPTTASTTSTTPAALVHPATSIHVLTTLSPPSPAHSHHFSPGARLSASSLERTFSNDSDDSNPIGMIDAPHGMGTHASTWRHPDPHHQHNHSHLDHTHSGSNVNGAGTTAPATHASMSTHGSSSETILAQAAGLAMLRHVSTTGYEYERHATPSASPVAMLPLYMPSSPSTLVPILDQSRTDLVHHTSASEPSPRSTTIHSPSSARNKVAGMSLNDADLHHLGMSLEEKSSHHNSHSVPAAAAAVTSAPMAASSSSSSTSNRNGSNGVSSLVFSDAAINNNNAATAPLSSRTPGSARRVALDPSVVDNYHARANAYKMVVL